MWTFLCFMTCLITNITRDFWFIDYRSTFFDYITASTFSNNYCLYFLLLNWFRIFIRLWWLQLFSQLLLLLNWLLFYRTLLLLFHNLFLLHLWLLFFLTFLFFFLFFFIYCKFFLDVSSSIIGFLSFIKNIFCS